MERASMQCCDPGGAGLQQLKLAVRLAVTDEVAGAGVLLWEDELRVRHRGDDSLVELDRGDELARRARLRLVEARLAVLVAVEEPRPSRRRHAVVAVVLCKGRVPIDAPVLVTLDLAGFMVIELIFLPSILEVILVLEVVLELDPKRLLPLR